MNQGTIKQAVPFKGRGLHTGKRTQITICPADENTGIIFKRVDKAGKNTEISSALEKHQKTSLCVPA